jgi:hypothetical protein
VSSSAPGITNPSEQAWRQISIHLCQPARLHVVDKSAHRDVLRNPRVRLDLRHLLADVFFQIIERVEMRRLGGDCAHFFGELRAQFVLLHLQQAAVGVVDDDELLRIEQVMGDDQRADGVLGGDASGVADHVGVAGAQAEAVLEQDARIHARQHGGVALRMSREFAQIEVAGKFRVGFQQFVSYGQGKLLGDFGGGFASLVVSRWSLAKTELRYFDRSGINNRRWVLRCFAPQDDIRRQIRFANDQRPATNDGFIQFTIGA